MSTTTDKLALFKYDPSTDGAQTFNIQKALNENWDKLDDAVKQILITLANKAPGGFGLGTISQTVTDFDTVKLNGWYWGAAGAAHAPDSEHDWSVCVTNLVHNSEVCVQDAYAITNVNKYLHCRRLVYIGTATQDNPWEWVNPPMELGIEYRTVERFQGKPVYVKVVDCGVMTNNKTIAITDESKRILDVILKGNPTPFPMVPNGSGLGEWDGCFTAGGLNITLYAGGELAASNHYVVAIAKLIDA